MAPAVQSPFPIDAENGFYHIAYVRVFAPTENTGKSNFYNAYYNYSEKVVEKRNIERAVRFETLLVFERQLIRFIKEYG